MVEHTFALAWGGGRGRGIGAWSAIDGPGGPRPPPSSWRMGPEIFSGRFFLFPPLLSEILDRSSDMAAGWDRVICRV